MEELSTELHEQIKTLCSKGDVFAKEENFSKALGLYWLHWIANALNPLLCYIVPFRKNSESN